MEFKPLSIKDRDNLRLQFSDGFLRGSCFAFAIAVHRGTGYPLVGLRADGETEIYHAGVKTPNGTFFDARGELENLEAFAFASEFGVGKYKLVSITEADLKRGKEVDSHNIETACLLIEAMWPDLPWGENSYKFKVNKFAQALEALSQEHGVWVRSPYPGPAPFLSIGDGTEMYVVKPIPTGTSYTLEREFK